MAEAVATGGEVVGVTGANGASTGVDVWAEGGCDTGVVEAITGGADVD